MIGLDGVICPSSSLSGYEAPRQVEMLGRVPIACSGVQLTPCDWSRRKLEKSFTIGSSGDIIVKDTMITTVTKVLLHRGQETGACSALWTRFSDKKVKNGGSWMEAMVSEWRGMYPQDDDNRHRLKYDPEKAEVFGQLARELGKVNGFDNNTVGFGNELHRVRRP